MIISHNGLYDIVVAIKEYLGVKIIYYHNSIVTVEEDKKIIFITDIVDDNKYDLQLLEDAGKYYDISSNFTIFCFQYKLAKNRKVLIDYNNKKYSFTYIAGYDQEFFFK